MAQKRMFLKGLNPYFGFQSSLFITLNVPSQTMSIPNINHDPKMPISGLCTFPQAWAQQSKCTQTLCTLPVTRNAAF